MAEEQNAQQRFLETMTKILPVVKYGTLTSRKVTLNGEEHELPEHVLPVIFPVSFDTLSIVFGVDDGTHMRWLQNQDIEIAQSRAALDDVMTRAYQNLYALVRDTIAVTRINEHTGMLTNCRALESSFFVTNEIWEYICSTLNATDVVYAIPTQDIFIFCDARSAENIAFIRSKVEEVFRDESMPRKVSPNVYLREGNGENKII